MNIIRNKLHLLIFTVLALAAMLVLAQPAGAAPITWNNAAGGNWSVGPNWSTLAAPGTADDVIFGNVGAGSPNTNDISSETIDSLTYNQNNALQQTTVINPGRTLTINSSIAAGNTTSLLYVGGANVNNLLVPAVMQGGGNLTLNGAADLVARQGGVAGGSQIATLDLSGLNNFNATIGRILLGVTFAGDSVNRDSGTLILAATNNITLTGTLPQVMVQNSTVNANGSVASVLELGQVNNIFANGWRIGGDKGVGNINFNPNFSSPSLVIRAGDGVSPCTVIDFGYAGDINSGNNTACTADFSSGTVDISATLVHIAQGQLGPSAGYSDSTVTLGAGTLNVADLEIGYGNAAGANTGGTAGIGTAGTLNVNNNGLFSTGAVVIASTVLNLARTNGPVSAITGTLNIGSDNTAGTVIANAITSGGGNSFINLNAGVLVVSNTAGSLSHPIRNFSIGASGAATLSVPLSASGAAVTVSNLTTAGANTVNITAVPGIASYPATFTLIQYQGTENGSGAGTFTALNLPPASPSYAGSIVDTGNGKVQVTLTSGPLLVLSMVWTGSTDNNWDYATQNWLHQGNPSVFLDGYAPLFNDSTTQTNISLDASPLSPSSVTVTNNLLQYTFGGSGYITAGTLTKSGSSSLTLDNSGGDNNISTVVINGGTLQIGAGDANGGLQSVNITNNGALLFDRTDNVTLGAAITGTGTLTQGGGGTLVLSGANSYNGATSLTNGTLEIDQTSSGIGPVTASAGTVLSGNGVVNGPVTVGGELSPGSSTLPGNFQAGNGLTLSTGSTLNFGLSATDTSTTDNANDSVAVTGNLTVHNNTINVNFAGTPQVSGYTLFTYTGTLSGSFNPVITGTHFAVALDTNSSPGSVLLNITGGSGYNLDWSSTSDGTWDNATTNWLNLGNSTPSTFAAGDSVLFDDTPGVQTTITIGAGVTVYPSVITNNATNNNFTISGAGHIGGSAGIVKSGPSTLAIATANSFTGTVDIQGGTLQTQNGAALGNAVGTTVENGGTLDIDGQSLGNPLITISGAGADGSSGALVNNGAGQVLAFRNLTLAADATIGGSGEIELNNQGGSASLSTGGNPFNLTKVGANILNFQNLSTFDAALANIDIQAGTLLFNGLTPGMGNPAFTNTVETGATLAFGGDSVTWLKNFVFNGDGTTITLNNEGGANCVLAGPVTLNGNCVLSIGGTQLIISNNISGGGGLIKSGTAPLILDGTTGPNTYTGDTLVNAGTLQLVNGATISTSSNITLAAGTTLNMGGTVLTLASGHSLNGNGTVTNSSLSAGAGSTVSPGVGAVGMLTVGGAITLSGTNIMEVDTANATNDVLRSSGGSSSITYGGTLNVVDLAGNSLTNGSSFKLFSATSYSGSFSSVVPATPGAGLTWNTSALTTSGTLSVASSIVTHPHFNGVLLLNSTNLVISGTNGTASGTYYVLASTNVAMPLANWTRVATNSFSGTGTFNFTNSVNPSTPQRFYLLQLP